MNESLDSLLESLREFIRLSQSDEDKAWREWVRTTAPTSPVRCWERMGCTRTECSAYGREEGRCWLVAGTLCGREPQGQFASSHSACTSCPVFQESVERNRFTELREYILILVSICRAKQTGLQAALEQVRILSGLLPICAYCKKIRDDSGSWQQIESYIAGRTEATFSHGICPECLGRIEGESDAP